MGSRVTENFTEIPTNETLSDWTLKVHCMFAFTITLGEHGFCELRVVAVNLTWLHTRAFKYNPSTFGTYFECEGVKCTYLNFT